MRGKYCACHEEGYNDNINSVDMKELQELMPLIVEKYIVTQPSTGELFIDFLNNFLVQCSDVGQLREMLTTEEEQV